MAKNIDIGLLQQEHTSIYNDCITLCKEIEHQIYHLIENEHLKLAVPIQYRAKTWTSIAEKIEQKRFTVKKSITEVQDLAGVRIILLFSRDVDKVIELIESNFKVLKKYNNEDKLNDDQFGYSSIHFVVELISEWLKIPTLSKFKGMKIEFQLRTLSQHSWAEVSNILQYKQEDNVPKPLKRSISRISALLETVDLEYERLLIDRNTYKKQIQEIKFEDIDSILNVDLLEQILDKYLPSNNKANYEDYSELLEDLQKVGYETNFKLSKLIKDNIEETLNFDKEIADAMLSNYKKTGKLAGLKYSGKKEDISRIQKGYFLAHTGLMRQMLERVIGKPLWQIPAYSPKAVTQVSPITN